MLLNELKLMRLANDLQTHEPKLNDEEYMHMKQKLLEKMDLPAAKPRMKRPLRTLLVAAAICAMLAMTVSAVGMKHILQVLHFGNGNMAVQVEDRDVRELPEGLQGRVFDKNGVPLTELRRGEAMYNAEGQQIVDFDGTNLLTEKQTPESPEITSLKTVEEAAKHLNFVPLIPQQLPKGFALDHIELYGSADDLNGDYATFVYLDGTGNHFTLSQRQDTPETATSINTDGEMKKVRVNGVDAVLLGTAREGYFLEWVHQDKVLSLAAKKAKAVLNEQDILDIANSIK